jgi:hypothetical protein
MPASLRQTFDCLVHTSLVAKLLDSIPTRPAAALLATPNLHLRTVQGAASPTDDDPSHQTEIVFSGYAAFAVVWEVVQINLAVDGKGLRAVCTFAPNAAVAPPVTAVGWYLTDTGNTVVQAEGQFSEPVVFGGVGDVLDFVLILPLIDQWA